MKVGDLVQQKHLAPDQTEPHVVYMMRTGIIVKMRETEPSPWSDVLVMWAGQTNLSIHTARNLILFASS